VGFPVALRNASVVLSGRC